MIERQHLEILRKLKDKGTLTHAAGAMHISQSAVSHSIKKLEQLAGTAIWQQKGRMLQFTEAGKMLLELAERLLPQFEYAEKKLMMIAAGKKGELRLGMECHPCYQWLVQVVSTYLKKWPAVDMDIKKRFAFDGVTALKNFEIDLLLTPDPSQDEELKFHPVFDYELVLVVGENHDLAGRHRVNPSDLVRENLYTYPVAKERLDIFTHFLLPAGCLPARHQLLEDVEMMVQMTAAGRGVTALPDWMARTFVEQLPLKALRLGERGILKKLYLAVRKADLPVAYVNSFIDHAREAGQLS